MLHQFTFKNYKSFKNETTLDLLAADIEEHPNDVVIDILNEKVLKVAAIYGANASGKSNVLSAFKVMKNIVLLSFRENRSNSIVPYWFEGEDVPTEFDVLFSTEGSIYQYGFSYLKEKIVNEYLYRRGDTEEKEEYITIFERSGSKIKDIADFEEISEAAKLLDLIDENILYLSVLSRLKIKSARSVYEWFSKTGVIDYGNPNIESRKLRELISMGFERNNPASGLVSIIEHPKEKEKLLKFVKAIDVGIDGFEIIEDTREIADEERTHKRILTRHRIPNSDRYIRTSITNESSGTIKMLFLYVDIVNVLRNGSTLFIDELDAKLHPLLIRYIIILFHDREQNKNNAQLIFSTQEVFTLDKSNFRRDEIWFVDKDEYGVSDLYSLYSYIDEDKEVQSNTSYGKDYILGRYKSIPNLQPLGEDYA